MPAGQAAARLDAPQWAPAAYAAQPNAWLQQMTVLLAPQPQQPPTTLDQAMQNPDVRGEDAAELAMLKNNGGRDPPTPPR